MLDMLAEHDPDIEMMVKLLYNSLKFPYDYSMLFNGMDLKEPNTKKYCYGLAVRELVMSIIDYGIDIEDVGEVEYLETSTIEQLENEVA
jgi:hypothetical protein